MVVSYMSEVDIKFVREGDISNLSSNWFLAVLIIGAP